MSRPIDRYLTHEFLNENSAFETKRQEVRNTSQLDFLLREIELPWRESEDVIEDSYERESEERLETFASESDHEEGLNELEALDSYEEESDFEEESDSYDNFERAEYGELETTEEEAPKKCKCAHSKKTTGVVSESFDDTEVEDLAPEDSLSLEDSDTEDTAYQSESDEEMLDEAGVIHEENEEQPFGSLYYHIRGMDPSQYENFVPQDEKLNSALSGNRNEVLAKNMQWWLNLRMDLIQPFGDISPLTPHALANVTYNIQKALNGSGISKALGSSISTDGILGPMTWRLILYATEQVRQNNTAVIANLAKYAKSVNFQSIADKISQGYNALPKDSKEKFDDTRLFVIATSVKPVRIWSGKFDTNITALAQFLSENAMQYASTRKGIDFEPEVLNGLIYYLLGDEEGPDAALALKLDHKLEAYRLFYKEGGSISAVPIVFSAQRSFVHRLDTERLNPEPNFKRFSFGIVTSSYDVVSHLQRTVQLPIPKIAAVQKALDAMNVTLPNPKSINGLVTWFYFPKETPQGFTAAKYFVTQKVLEIRMEEAAALEYTQQLDRKMQESKRRPADITDAEIFMELITYPVRTDLKNKSEVERLFHKADQETFITINLANDAEAVVLPYLRIVDMRERAKINDKVPLYYGEFEPPSKAYNVHPNKYKVIPDPDVIKLTISEKGYGDRQVSFGKFEPVKVRFGLITQKLLRSIKYNVTDFWVISDSLAEVGKNLEEAESASKTAEGLNIVITAASAISVGYGALRASIGSAVVPAVGRTFIKELIKKSLFFVIEEKVAEVLLDAFMALEKKIMADGSDTEKGLWGAFKTGLMLLGGAVAVRAAFRGLKQVMSPKLIGHLDEWEIALLKAERRAQATGAKRIAFAGLDLADKAIAESMQKVLKAKKWAADQFKLSLATLRDLTVDAIEVLKKLPADVIQSVSKLSDRAKRIFFGCHSPCITDTARMIRGQRNVKLMTPLKEIVQLNGKRNWVIDPALIDIAFYERACAGITLDHFKRLNVATAKFVVTINGKSRTSFYSAVNESIMHSEEIILGRLQELRLKFGYAHVKMTQLFTERSPCTAPSNCRFQLQQHSSETQVFFAISHFTATDLGTSKAKLLRGYWGVK